MSKELCLERRHGKPSKTLGTNVKFQFILPEELQSQIEKRAGKEAVGKPKQQGKMQHQAQSDIVVLDPTKLSIPDGSFVGGEKAVNQIPLSLLGPLAEGIVIATWQQAEPYLRSSPTFGTWTVSYVWSSRDQLGDVPLLSQHKRSQFLPGVQLTMSLCCFQLGGVSVARAFSQSPVPIDMVKVSTLKLVLFKDECWQPWEEITAAPLRYIIHNVPLLKFCKQPDCTCPHWHNHEKVEATESIVDVWRRQFLRAGYKPEPVATSTIFSVCIRVPDCLTERLLACSWDLSGAQIV